MVAAPWGGWNDLLSASARRNKARSSSSGLATCTILQLGSSARWRPGVPASEATASLSNLKFQLECFQSLSGEMNRKERGENTKMLRFLTLSTCPITTTTRDITHGKHMINCNRNLVCKMWQPQHILFPFSGHPKANHLEFHSLLMPLFGQYSEKRLSLLMKHYVNTSVEDSTPRL